MTLPFTEDQFRIVAAYLLRGAVPPANFSDAYRDLYDWLEDKGYPEARNWLGGAIQANAGVGPFADLIRNYTMRQGLLRGLSLEFLNQNMQLASDSVAQRLLQDIADRRPDALSLAQISVNDASAVGETLFYQDPLDTASTANAAWAGTLLFGPLGRDETGRLLTAGDPERMDTLDDLRNLLFAADAYIVARASVMNRLKLNEYSGADLWHAANVSRRTIFGSPFGGWTAAAAADGTLVEREFRTLLNLTVAGALDQIRSVYAGLLLTRQN
jgi:hypothetical protein